ncbi:MAG: hypothetical protein CBC48_20080 [bacterium TMED88]|nr:hypothetical protein [Deltaproteobacteria bacterium]OUV21627.1 MAG: hypothetical protein CBC48_20080 [bacterium TMED88]
MQNVIEAHPRQALRPLSPQQVLTGSSLILALLWLPASASARCLPWEPDPVTLVGELEMRELPGPPSYRNIAKGDFAEPVYFVRLEEAVCVSEDLESSLPRKSHHGMTEIQLSIPKERRSSLTPLVGKRIRLSGTLFSGSTGYYRTPVAIRVTSFRGG